MQLITSRFGSIEFEPAELLVCEHGLLAHPQDRQWLLLADSQNAALYWLQSISDSATAIPVVSLPCDGRVVDTKTSSMLKLHTDSEVLLLAPIRCDGVLSIDTHLPIVVNTKLGKCRQLRNERHQADQRTMALLSERLRQSA